MIKDGVYISPGGRCTAPSALEDVEYVFQLCPQLADNLLTLIDVDFGLFTGQFLSGAADREAVLVEQAPDLANKDDVLTLVVAAVAPTPILARRAATGLLGKQLTRRTIVGAGERAALAAKPITDMRGTAEQRRHLVGVLTRRALRGAIQRAREG